jgi:hypothetical protein
VNFKCECYSHILKVIKEKSKFLKEWIWIGIYNNEGKLLGDVELTKENTKN